ncbi:hypothetical protein PAPYR_10790 [Paratrimastix pyriformis]|uniref:Uncharacterized protein n=1 Tax=Paratrimastix pyriformis TaxID=342808 RepID=A0ABQ8U546_9EUKA|nr:hypothetical protein PAPYR_10790 [Paratrimastix pyriformis]
MDTSKEPRKSKGTHRRRAADYDDETEEIVAICAAVMSKMMGKQVLYDAAIIQAASRFRPEHYMKPKEKVRRAVRKVVLEARDTIKAAEKAEKEREDKERADKSHAGYLKLKAVYDGDMDRMAREHPELLPSIEIPPIYAIPTLPPPTTGVAPMPAPTTGGRPTSVSLLPPAPAPGNAGLIDYEEPEEEPGEGYTGAITAARLEELRKSEEHPAGDAF